MEKAFIDGKDRVLSHQQKVRDVLSAILTHLPNDRVITEISVDGKQLQDASLSDPIESRQQFEMRTAHKELWTESGIDIALVQIEQVKKSLIRTAELLRNEDWERGHRLFLHCIEGLERYMDTIRITRSALGQIFETFRVDQLSLPEIEQNFLSILEGLLQRQEEENFSELADTLECSLLTNLCAWSKTLGQLKSVISHQDGWLNREGT